VSKGLIVACCVCVGSPCSREKQDVHPRVATLDGFAHVPADNDTALAQAVSQHPVAVAVCCGARRLPPLLLAIASRCICASCLPWLSRALLHAPIPSAYATSSCGRRRLLPCAPRLPPLHGTLALSVYQCTSIPWQDLLTACASRNGA
jgi:hypothetical protein